MATSTNSPSLLVLRVLAVLTALASLVQAVLGGLILSGGSRGAHSAIGMTTFGLAAVAAIAAIVWARPSGNKGLMFHAIGVAALGVVQIGLGEAGLTAIHITVGVLFLVAAVALATLSIRKPLTTAD